MNLTTGICLIFRGLNFESNEEFGENSHLWTGTNYIMTLSVL
jgi:hypothetical protein